MPTLTVNIDYSTDAERLALEQTLAYFADLRRVATDAPPGTVLHACEKVVLDRGRAALRAALAAAVQVRIDAGEAAQKKSPGRGRRDSGPAGS